MTQIAVVDVGSGNLGSVVNMVRHLDGDPVVVAGPTELCATHKILLPGVGHFDAAMRRLLGGGLADALREHVATGGDLLGICLGMQLLLEGSDEGELPGLGLIAGRSLRLSAHSERRLRVPHMGWNAVEYDHEDLTEPSVDGHWYYFVHSYAVPASNPHTVGRTRHGEEFASVISSGQILGAQFHPEKSHRHGMAFLRSWMRR